MTRSSNCAATASYSWATRQQESCARYSRLRCGTRVSPLPPPPFFESKVLYLKLIMRSRSVHNYIADSYGKIKCQRSAYACSQSAGRTFPAYRSRLDYYSTNWFVSTGTNSMECLTNWIPLRIRVRSRNNQPHLTPVAGPIFETKNRAIFLERFFWRDFSGAALLPVQLCSH